MKIIVTDGLDNNRQDVLVCNISDYIGDKVVEFLNKEFNNDMYQYQLVEDNYRLNEGWSK